MNKKPNDRMEKLLTPYWDKWLVKVCCNRIWKQMHRKENGCNISFNGHVSESSEACCLWTFENALKRWTHRALVLDPRELDCKSEELFNMVDGKKSTFKTEHIDMVTPLHRFQWRSATPRWFDPKR